MLIPALIIVGGFLLIYFLIARRPDFTDRDNAPPQLGGCLPHDYDELYGDDQMALGCCKFCGGGKNHEIHGGPVKTERKASDEPKVDIEKLPGAWM